MLRQTQIVSLGFDCLELGFLAFLALSSLSSPLDTACGDSFQFDFQFGCLAVRMCNLVSFAVPSNCLLNWNNAVIPDS